jgi:hypothetical protein
MRRRRRRNPNGAMTMADTAQANRGKIQRLAAERDIQLSDRQLDFIVAYLMARETGGRPPLLCASRRAVIRPIRRIFAELARMVGV